MRGVDDDGSARSRQLVEPFCLGSPLAYSELHPVPSLCLQDVLDAQSPALSAGSSQACDIHPNLCLSFKLSVDLFYQTRNFIIGPN